MRQDNASRRPSLFQRLFAERQVYLRSGQDSRYVVLSRPFQIGVTLATLVIIGGLAFASYSSVANHLEAMERSREVARLEGVNKSLRAAAETPTANEEMRAAGEQVPELDAALAEAQAAQKRAEELAEASAAEAEALRHELQLAQERVQRVTERANQRIEELQAELEAARTEVARLQTEAVEPGAGPGAGEETMAALTADLAQAKNGLEALRDDAEGGGGDLSSLKDQLTAASQQLDQFDRVLDRLKAREAAIDLAMSSLAPPPPPPAPR